MTRLRRALLAAAGVCALAVGGVFGLDRLDRAYPPPLDTAMERSGEVVDRDGLDVHLERYRPGDKVSLLVSRRGELRRYKVTLGRTPTDRWSLSVRPDATPEQRERLMAWLGAQD